MRCSDCMREIKPVVAVDLDGTLADYHGHFIQFTNLYFNREPPPDFPEYNGVGKFRHWWCAAYRASNAQWNQVKLAYRQGAQKRSQPLLEPETDHHAWFNALNRLGIEIWITTTRPHLSLDRVDPDTRFWLAEHGIDYYGLLYDDDKYAVLQERVGGERVIAVVDDLPEMYDAAAGFYGEDVPVLRQGWYNAGIKRRNMASDLGHVTAHIIRNLERWDRQHG